MIERIIVIPITGRDKTVRAYSLISEEDADRVLPYLWSLQGYGYAWRTVRHERPRHVYLHRLIAGCLPGDGLFVDHINRDRLDNRRSNLRIVTPAQSRQNTPAIGGSSRYRGVRWDASRRKWAAAAQLDGRMHHLGRYPSEEDAARAAREWRIEHMPFTVEDLVEPGHRVGGDER